MASATDDVTNVYQHTQANMLDVSRQTVCYSISDVDHCVTGSVPVFKEESLTIGRQRQLFNACHDVMSHHLYQ